MFSGKNAVKENGPDGPTTDVLLLRSKDRKVEMGLYEAGPSEQDIESYEDDEFMFFLAGGVTLTSSDGTVLQAQSGEGVAIPKGWKGHWSTKGYKKYYVTYTGGAAVFAQELLEVVAARGLGGLPLPRGYTCGASPFTPALAEAR